MLWSNSPLELLRGKLGYVGETDVRIDTSAQGQSWDNEVINKRQFEDGLRQVEPQLSDEELDKLPISAVMDGKVQTFPDAVALDEALNAVPAGNFRITDDHLGEGGAKQKYARNIEAIRTLFKLEEEHRGATAEEQQVLSQYVGWGGLADAFDPNKENWSAEYTQLKELLSEDEYAAARASTLNAHYTSPTVIRSIYDAVERMGFRSGNILEPSMGVGNFFGMLPDSMADSRLYGVELDSITGRIAKKLYPQADITVAGFETTDRRDFYDLAVGNVPFGQYKVNDKAYNKLGFSIHNYFFAKAIDQVRPGGIVAFVTSRYTMDSKDSTARKHMAERADLLGAIRLPNNAFRANAGTDVVSDIIFLQKRDRPIDHEPDWVQSGKTEDGFAINQYFADHPEMVLGVLSTESTQYGREELTVAPIEGANLADQLAEAVQHIEGQYTAAEVDAPDIAEEETARRTLPADPDVKNFSYTVVDGEVFYRENSVMTQVELSDTAKGRVTGMVELRQIVNELIDQQLNDYPDEDIKTTQERLNAAYGKRNLIGAPKTCYKVAAESGVGRTYVIEAEHYAKGLDAAEEAVPGTRQKVLSGEVRPAAAEIASVARAPPEERPALVAEICKPKPPKPPVQKQKAPPAVAAPLPDASTSEEEAPDEEPTSAPTPSEPVFPQKENEPLKVDRQQLLEIANNRYHVKQLANGAAMLCEVSGAANSMMRRWESVFREYPDILSDAENRASVGRTIQKLRDYLKNLEDKMEELL